MDTVAIGQLLKDTAREVITPRFRQLADAEVVEKKPGDLVTVADREAEEYLAGRLKEHHPGALIVGEEGVFLGTTALDDLAVAPLAFVIDPIDGTRNFVEGRAQHGVMLAEVRHGVTARGWIWQPQFERMWTVEAGSGQVLMNGEPVVGQSKHALPTGAAGQRRRLGYTAEGKLGPTVRSSGAAAFDYPNVLTGEIDFMYFTNAHPWDHLAGCLMLAETGGVGRMLNGEDYTAATRGKGLMVARTREIWDLAADGWEL